MMMLVILSEEKARKLGLDINKHHNKIDNYFISSSVKKEIPNSVFPFIMLVRNHNSFQLF